MYLLHLLLSSAAVKETHFLVTTTQPNFPGLALLLLSIYYLEWLEQTKNNNPFEKSTGKQFND